MHFTRFCKTQLLLKIQLFTKVPGTFCRFTTIPSAHTKHPGNKSDLAMWPLGAVAGAGGAIPARLAASAGRERAGGRSRGVLGPVWKVGRGGGAAGDGRRRQTRAAAAVACRPASGCAGWGDGWLLELLWILEGASVGSVDRGGGHRQVSRGGGHGGPWWTRGTATRRWRVREEEEQP
jgi:hypothetical protein